MKKLIIALCLTCAFTLVSHAAEGGEAGEKKAEGKKPALTEEQKAARKELVTKYDANKDGKLDDEERSKVPAEELEKAGMKKEGKKKKKAE